MATVVCPICNKDDHIQRVSAVASIGTTTGNYSGPTSGIAFVDGKTGNVSGYSYLSGQSSTNLAKQISLPPKPEVKSGFRWWMYIVYFYCVAFIFSGCVSVSGIREIADLVMPAGSLIVGGGLIWLTTNKKNKDHKKSEEQYKVEYPKWIAYKNEWERLYYCHRDGIVFRPERGTYCQPSEIKDFIQNNI